MLRRFVMLIMCCVVLLGVLCSCGAEQATDKDALPEAKVVEVSGGEKKSDTPLELVPAAGAEDVSYADYDNVVLSGTQVKEVFKQFFEAKNMALLVATQMVMDGTITLNKLDENVPAEMPTVGAVGLNGIYNTAGEDISDRLTFVNYGVLIAGPADDVTITFKGDHFVAENGLAMNGDSYVVNSAIEKTMKDGYSENIADYLKLQTYLVKDSQGEVIGLAFYAVK